MDKKVKKDDKTNKLITFDEDLMSRIEGVRRKIIADRIEKGSDDISLSFRKVVLILIDKGLESLEK